MHHVRIRWYRVREGAQSRRWRNPIGRDCHRCRRDGHVLARCHRSLMLRRCRLYISVRGFVHRRQRWWWRRRRWWWRRRWRRRWQEAFEPWHFRILYDFSAGHFPAAVESSLRCAVRREDPRRRGSRGRRDSAYRIRRPSPPPRRRRRRRQRCPRCRRPRRHALDTVSRHVSARNVAPLLARRHRLSLVRVPGARKFVRLIEASLTRATSRRRHYVKARDIDPWRKMAARITARLPP